MKTPIYLLNKREVRGVKNRVKITIISALFLCLCAAVHAVDFLIDNFDDGDEYNIFGGGTKQDIGNEPAHFSIQAPGSSGTGYAACLSYTAYFGNPDYNRIRMFLTECDFTGTTDRTVNMKDTDCTGIRFKFRSNVPYVYVELNSLLGGISTLHSNPVPAEAYIVTGNWQTMEIPFGSFYGWENCPFSMYDYLQNLESITFVAHHYDPLDVLYLEIDDVEFYGCNGSMPVVPDCWATMPTPTYIPTPPTPVPVPVWGCVTPDTSLNGTGYYLTVTGVTQYIGTIEPRPESIMLDGDGRILRIGEKEISMSQYSAAIYRQYGNGTYDTSFGTGGELVFNPAPAYNCYPNKIAALLGDGFYLATIFYEPSFTGQKFSALSKFDQNGNPDATYNGTGTIFISNPYNNESLAQIEGLKVDSAGNALVLVYLEDASGGYAINQYHDICRFTTGGLLDTSFNGTGHLYFGPDMATYRPIWEIILDKQEKIIVLSSPPTANGYDNTFCLQRLTSSGQIDGTFNGGSPVTASKSIPGLGDCVLRPVQVREGPDNKIYVTCCITPMYGQQRMGVWRFNANGSLDAAYGNSGIYIYNSESLTGGMDFDDAGNLLVAGGVVRRITGNIDSCLWRINTSGNLDATFNASGMIQREGFSGYNRNEYFDDIRVLGGNTLLVFGTSTFRNLYGPVYTGPTCCGLEVQSIIARFVSNCGNTAYTPTPIRTITQTKTLTPFITATGTPTEIFTGTTTETASQTLSATPDSSFTYTPTITCTDEATAAETPSMTPSATESPDYSNTPAYTFTPTPYVSATETVTPTYTPSLAPSATDTAIPAMTPTYTPSRVPSMTYTPTPAITATRTATPTLTPATPGNSLNLAYGQSIPYPNPYNVNAGPMNVVFNLGGVDTAEFRMYSTSFRLVASVSPAPQNVGAGDEQKISIDQAGLQGMANGLYIYTVTGTKQDDGTQARTKPALIMLINTK